METACMFERTKLPGGTCLLKLSGDKLTRECTDVCIERNLNQILSEVTNSCVLDLSALYSYSENLDGLAPIILKFITDSQPQNGARKNIVIAHEQQFCKLRGKVIGVLLSKIKDVVGDVINLPGISTSVRTREVFNNSFLDQFIVSHNQANHFQSVKTQLDVLNSVDFSQVTPNERQSIIKTYKQVINKIKRSSGLDVNDQNNCGGEKCKNKNTSNSSENPNQPKSMKAKKCYVCKQLFSYPKKKKVDEIWKTYPRLCRSCGEFNFKKRTQKADLNGKYAVVTGGRIKIEKETEVVTMIKDHCLHGAGFELVLKLLRDGCHVITTTRFPHDAAKRYEAQGDFNDWKNRLRIYAVDLKDIPGVYKFIKHVQDVFPHLDILVNNAAQTIRRPLDFFWQLMDYECIPRDHIPEAQQEVLVQQEVLNYGYHRQQLPQKAANAASSLPTVVELNGEESGEPESKRARTQESVLQPTVTLTSQRQDESRSNLNRAKESLGCDRSVPYNRSTSLDSSLSNATRCDYAAANPCTSRAVTQQTTLPFTHDVIIHTGSAFSSVSRYFPRGALDADGQQLDLRRKNSWRMQLDDIPMTEVIEILVVNVIAPFLLNKELKGMLCRSPAKRRFIVNVSAMEGQFNRQGKTKFHPHTNMGKAALNMMTRTAALGYKEKDIYMTSVDTGWVTDERPFYMAKHEQRVKGFKLPLDNIDGAARIYDPIVLGLTDEKTPYYAVFLKNYAEYQW